MPDAYDELLSKLAPLLGDSIPIVRESVPLRSARYGFLSALSKRQPAVLESLREGPFKIFSQSSDSPSVYDVIATMSKSQRDNIVRGHGGRLKALSNEVCRQVLFR
jgi:hypothetical protein